MFLALELHRATKKTKFEKKKKTGGIQEMNYYMICDSSFMHQQGNSINEKV